MYVHDDFSIGVAGGTTDDLEERGFGAEESDFFRIQYADETRFWEVESFSEEIDSDDDIYLTETIGAQYLESFDGFYFGVKIADFYPIFSEVVGEVFR